MKTIPAVRTAHRAVPVAAPRHHPAEAAVPDRVPQVVAVPAVAVPQAVALQVLLTDRICPVVVVFSDFREGNWCCTRSEVVRMTEMMTHPMTIPQVPTVPAVAVLHPRPAAVLRAAVVPAVAVVPVPAVALQVLHTLRNRVPRTMILQVPVIPAMMTAMN